jgi:hypothetical protein
MNPNPLSARNVLIFPVIINLFLALGVACCQAGVLDVEARNRPPLSAPLLGVTSGPVSCLQSHRFFRQPVWNHHIQTVVSQAGLGLLGWLRATICTGSVLLPFTSLPLRLHNLQVDIGKGFDARRNLRMVNLNLCGPDYTPIRAFTGFRFCNPSG